MTEAKQTNTNTKQEKLWNILGFLGLIFLITGAGLYFYKPSSLAVISRIILGLGFLCTVASALGNLVFSGSAQLTKRQAKYGTSSSLAIILVLLILGFVNYISSNRNIRFDLTDDKKFTLSEQTKKILGDLKDPVRITCFFELADEKVTELKSLLKEYHYSSSNIDFEFIDPVSRPDAIEKYNITRLGTIVFRSGDRTEQTFGTGEVDLTSTLLKLVYEREKKVVYITEGHNELDPESHDDQGMNKFRDSMQNQNFEVKKISLISIEEIPGDAAAVIIAGPKVPFLDQELRVLQQHLNQQGKILLLLDPPSEEMPRTPSFNKILSKFGIKMEDNFIIDTASFLYPSVGVPSIEKFGWHQITKDFKYNVILPGARSITAFQTAPSGVIVEKLAETSEFSWGETRLVPDQEPSYDEAFEIKGPLIVAVAIEKTMDVDGIPDDPAGIGDKSPDMDIEIIDGQEEPSAEPEQMVQPKESLSRMVVVGDADIAANAVFEHMGNSDFLMNSLSWMCQEEQLISIRPKTPDLKPVMIDSFGWKRIFLLVIVFPLLILFAGFYIWWKRR